MEYIYFFEVINYILSNVAISYLKITSTISYYQDDLGGLSETSGTGKGLVKRFGAVVGLNSNGKGSKGAYGACPTTTTTTISNSSELGSNDDEVENDEDGYASSSDGKLIDM